MTIAMEPIGVIRTPLEEPTGVPRNTRDAADVAGTVEVDPAYASALKDLEGFSHVIVLFHFDRSDGYELQLRPRGRDVERGVFATRAPRRPNAIGLSVVRLESVEGCTLRVRGVDIVDGTPLLDIKPYLPSVDAIADARADDWVGGPGSSAARG